MPQFIKRAVFAAMLALLLAAVPALADSQVRIVRLSDVEGAVQVDRRTGDGFERALQNLPVTQGMVLQTGSNGRAEMEFEDGNIVRLAPDSRLEVQRLTLQDSGAKLSTVLLQQGSAYFNVNPKHKDEFTVAFAGRELPLTHKAHFRVDLGQQNASIAVFSGEVSLPVRGEPVKIKKNEELTLQLAGDETQLAKRIAPDASDDWDKQRGDYHESYYDTEAYNSYPYYGRGDLGYYGGWYDVAGYGPIWQPNNIAYGWSPFYNGYWSWYPGIGYTWVSGYPWGWLPYRYGSWVFVPGWGWGWRPGGHWNRWTAAPNVVNAPSGWIVPRPPNGTGGHPTVFVDNPPALKGPQTGPAPAVGSKLPPSVKPLPPTNGRMGAPDSDRVRPVAPPKVAPPGPAAQPPGPAGQKTGPPASRPTTPPRLPRSAPERSKPSPTPPSSFRSQGGMHGGTIGRIGGGHAGVGRFR